MEAGNWRVTGGTGGTGGIGGTGVPWGDDTSGVAAEQDRGGESGKSAVSPDRPAAGDERGWGDHWHVEVLQSRQ